MKADISVVIPIFNEEKNISILIDRLSHVLRAGGRSYEIIAVDDGSRDGSYEELRSAAKKELHLKILRFKINFGQTAALAAGIDFSTGGIIVTMDGDLENDPADIARLLKKIDEGYDVVSGWRQGRWKGSWLSRKLPSMVANKIISSLTGVDLHDYGCTLKAYRAEIIKGVNLYGEMHRFVPAYAAWQGGTVAEIPVNHTPRVHGRSNYGIGRVFRVLLDLVVVVFMHKYMNRPMHFFGMWGLLSLGLGFFAGMTAVALRVFGILHIVETPLPVLCALFVIVGVQLVMFGVIGEMLMRTYYESQNRRPYVLKQAEDNKG